jgi:hypothetical protein
MGNKYPSVSFLLAGLAIAALLLFSMSIKGTVFAHQKQLYTIGGDRYLFVSGFLNEPVYVDDKSGVALYVYTPDPKDLMSTDSNLTKPVEELQDSLKVEISAGAKTKVLDLEPDEEQPGYYTASFIPDVETTYKFRFFGNLSNTPVSIEYSCSPGAVSEDTVVSNSTEKISDTVTRNGVIGGYECPTPRSEGAFPEAIMSNVDINSKIMDLENRISALENTTTSK